MTNTKNLNMTKVMNTSQEYNDLIWMFNNETNKSRKFGLLMNIFQFMKNNSHLDFSNFEESIRDKDMLEKAYMHFMVVIIPEIKTMF